VIREIAYDRPEELASGVAMQIAADLRRSLLEHKGKAVLVVPGGTTPAPVFLRLRLQSLEWSRIIIMPSDERWIKPPHQDSNETLIREHLLQNKAEEATLFSLYRFLSKPHDAEGLINQELKSVTDARPIVMLGMGEDGHFASLFPHMLRLEEGLNPQGNIYCLAVDTVQKGYPRMSLTLSYLLQAKRIFLVFKGQAKRKLIDLPEGLPIEALLRQNRTDIEIHWVD